MSFVSKYGLWNASQRAAGKRLLAKVDAAGENRYAPSLFTFFSDESRADELEKYAKNDLPQTTAPEVAKAVDEIQFRAELKKRLALQLNSWIDRKLTTNGHE